MQDLTQHTSVLIFHPKRGNDLKLGYAKKHKLPVATPEWLWTSLSSAKKQDLRDYRLPVHGNDRGRPAEREESGPPRKTRR